MHLRQERRFVILIASGKLYDFYFGWSRISDATWKYGRNRASIFLYWPRRTVLNNNNSQSRSVRMFYNELYITIFVSERGIYKARKEMKIILNELISIEKGPQQSENPSKINQGNRWSLLLLLQWTLIGSRDRCSFYNSVTQIRISYEWGVKDYRIQQMKIIINYFFYHNFSYLNKSIIFYFFIYY